MRSYGSVRRVNLAGRAGVGFSGVDGSVVALPPNRTRTTLGCDAVGQREGGLRPPQPVQSFLPSVVPTTGTSIVFFSVSTLGTSTVVSLVPTTTFFESTSTFGNSPPLTLT